MSLFQQQFAPGLWLRFTLSLTDNADVAGLADGLALYILDSSGVAVPTIAPFGDYLLSFALLEGETIIETYGTDASRALSDGAPVSIEAPDVAEVTDIPELATVTICCGAVGLWLIAHRRQRLRHLGTVVRFNDDNFDAEQLAFKR